MRSARRARSWSVTIGAARSDGISHWCATICSAILDCLAIRTCSEDRFGLPLSFNRSPRATILTSLFPGAGQSPATPRDARAVFREAAAEAGRCRIRRDVASSLTMRELVNHMHREECQPVSLDNGLNQPDEDSLPTRTPYLIGAGEGLMFNRPEETICRWVGTLGAVWLSDRTASANGGRAARQSNMASSSRCPDTVPCRTTSVPNAEYASQSRF
jgi:hypothetical protein